ncbi:Phycocyanobilin:ferredoxin oxidoreductase PcyA [Prochlorococcus sp. MIT 0601]|nr:Phycocyanobilin:ferredoxin oxidoreductase PcyA [Prochlorococcus sp. MIT 0601]
MDLDPKLRNIYGKLADDELLIVNEVHKSIGFRKIHLEIAKIGSALEILHCVFFPDPRFDLPIFGVDIVAGIDGISAAIVDLSPVDESLPSSIRKNLEELNFPFFKNTRKLPEWGDIFSDYVLFIRPQGSSEKKSFQEIVNWFLDILIFNAKSIKPDSVSSPLTIARYNRQRNYCLQQKRNDKTRNVLAKTFGPNWADEYIDMVLFNCPKDFLEKLI